MEKPTWENSSMKIAYSLLYIYFQRIQIYKGLILNFNIVQWTAINVEYSLCSDSGSGTDSCLSNFETLYYNILVYHSVNLFPPITKCPGLNYLF